jgi:hypothetical protein
LHSAYLCLKVSATFSIITIFGSQKEARHIEHGFILEHKNVHYLREDTEHEQPSPRSETSTEFKKAIQTKGDVARVALDPRVPDKTICIGVEMDQREKAELI